MNIWELRNKLKVVRTCKYEKKITYGWYILIVFFFYGLIVILIDYTGYRTDSFGGLNMLPPAIYVMCLHTN